MGMFANQDHSVRISRRLPRAFRAAAMPSMREVCWTLVRRLISCGVVFHRCANSVKALVRLPPPLLAKNARNGHPAPDWEFCLGGFYAMLPTKYGAFYQENLCICWPILYGYGSLR